MNYSTRRHAVKLCLRVTVTARVVAVSETLVVAWAQNGRKMCGYREQPRPSETMWFGTPVRSLGIALKTSPVQSSDNAKVACATDDSRGIYEPVAAARDDGLRASLSQEPRHVARRQARSPARARCSGGLDV